MTTELFRQAGEALFGEHWFRPMAEALKVRNDTVWQWAKGRNPIPAGIWAEVTTMLDEEERRLATIRRTILASFGPFVDEHA
jgi:hypothetical protein